MEAAVAKPLLKVAALCGSLRKGSYNRGLVRAGKSIRLNHSFYFEFQPHNLISLFYFFFSVICVFVWGSD